MSRELNRSLWEALPRAALQELQFQRVRELLREILPHNGFYRQKLQAVGIETVADVSEASDFAKIPFTTHGELSQNQADHPPYGSNLTYPLHAYTRIHQTAGTRGRPLHCLDTEASWQWWAHCWKAVYETAGVTANDRVFFAFSFGPFIGFWSAYEGARLLGALAVPGGGMSSHQRARAILTHGVTVLVATPSSALHLAEVAREEGIDLTSSEVRLTIHAGEPGASVTSIKQRIEEQWGAQCFDHAGAAEVGAWGFECRAHQGLHLHEAEFLFEVIDPATGEETDDGELVITNLGRIGMPVIRYRTGDRVRVTDSPCECGSRFRRLPQGIIGRVDDVLVVRGVPVYPSAIENVVLRFPPVKDYAVDITRQQELDEMEVRVEIEGADTEDTAALVKRDLRDALGLRVRVTPVPCGTLPRFEQRARRFHDRRQREFLPTRP